MDLGPQRYGQGAAPPWPGAAAVRGSGEARVAFLRKRSGRAFIAPAEPPSAPAPGNPEPAPLAVISYLPGPPGAVPSNQVPDTRHHRRSD
jgi:hypothetical protein